MKRRYKAAAVAMAAVWIVIAACLLSDGGGRETPSGSITITEKTHNSGSENLTIDIVMPQVCGFGDADLEIAFNGMIERQVSGALSRAKEAADYFWSVARDEGYEPWPYIFFAEYEVKCNEGILSLKVTTLLETGGPGMPQTVYYNADIEQSRLIKLGELFKSEGYKEKINEVIEAEMSKNPARYLGDEPFFGVSDKTQFFISGGKLYITFAKYEVASGMTGEPEFLIPAEVIRGLLKREYRGLFD